MNFCVKFFQGGAELAALAAQAAEWEEAVQRWQAR